jgi:hypothetical protein
MHIRLMLPDDQGAVGTICKAQGGASSHFVATGLDAIHNLGNVVQLIAEEGGGDPGSEIIGFLHATKIGKTLRINTLCAQDKDSHETICRELLVRLLRDAAADGIEKVVSGKILASLPNLRARLGFCEITNSLVLGPKTSP